jgi:hypothetical protein
MVNNASLLKFIILICSYIIGVSEIVPIKMAVKTPIVKIIPKYSGGRL